MKKIVMMAAFLASSALAIDLPQDVLGGNCLKDYQTMYLKIEGHKAFAFGRDKASGKVGCGWSHGYGNIEETKAVAVQQCSKYVTKTKCRVVDVDGQFMIQDYLAKVQTKTVVPQVTTVLNNTSYEQSMAMAKRTIAGNCLPFFENYLKDRGYKVFAYVVDADGKYACGKTYNHDNAKSAQEIALRSCQENAKQRGKNGPKSACQVYAQANTIVWKNMLSSNTLENEINELVKLSKVTGGQLGVKKKIEQKVNAIKQEPLEKTLALTAKTLNKNLPEMLDEELRFDKVKAEGSKMLFHYTLVHYSNKTLSPRKLHSLMYPDVKKEVCEKPASIMLLKKGMKIDYVYKGVDMKKIATFSFDAKACGV